jgi:hypothetical protein
VQGTSNAMLELGREAFMSASRDRLPVRLICCAGPRTLQRGGAAESSHGLLTIGVDGLVLSHLPLSGRPSCFHSCVPILDSSRLMYIVWLVSAGIRSEPQTWSSTLQLGYADAWDMSSISLAKPSWKHVSLCSERLASRLLSFLTFLSNLGAIPIAAMFDLLPGCRPVIHCDCDQLGIPVDETKLLGPS